MVFNGLELWKGCNYVLIIWWIIDIWDLLGKDKFLVCEKSLCKRYLTQCKVTKKRQMEQAQCNFLFLLGFLKFGFCFANLSFRISQSTINQQYT